MPCTAYEILVKRG